MAGARLNIFMPFKAALRELAEILNARNDFTVVVAITLDGLVPGKSPDQWKIDRASSWCVSKGRRGRIRRRVFSADHHVLGEFEDRLDAMAFGLRFGTR